MLVNCFKLCIIYALMMIAKDIIFPESSYIKGMVVQSNESVCVIQPIEGPRVVAEAYHYCPVGYMVSAQLMTDKNATEFDSGLKITSLNVLIGL